MRNVAIVVVLAILGSSSLPAIEGLEPLLERNSGVVPQLGEEKETVPGETMYSEFDFPSQAIVRLSQKAAYNRKITLEAGEILLGHINRRGEKVFCSSKRRSAMHGGGLVCLKDTTRDSTFDRFSVEDTPTLVGKKMRLKEPIPFQIESAPLPARQAQEYVGDFYRRELIYQGAARGVLRLLYREFVNDMARAAFSQELSFDLEESDPTIVVVKGARLKILNAGNQGIEYIVEKGFN